MNPRPFPRDPRAWFRGRHRLVGALVRDDRHVDTAGRVGLDFVVVDAAGEPGDQVNLRRALLAAQAHGMTSLVRVRDAGEATRALAAGASGIVVAGDPSPQGARDIAEAILDAHEPGGAPGPGERRLALVEEQVERGLPGLDLDGVVRLASSGVPRSHDAGHRAAGRTVIRCASLDAARRASHDGHDVVLDDLDAVVEDALVDLVGSRERHRGPVGAPTETVMLLPGMLGAAETWDGVAVRLLDVADPVACRIDLDDSIGEMAATVLASAPTRWFALAGHSLGGIVALEVIRQAPDRVTRLALCNTSGRDASPAQLAAWSQLADRVRSEPFPALAPELALGNLPEHRRDDPGLVAAGTAMARRVGPDGLLRQLAAQATRPDSLPHLHRIHVPTLVLTGGRDQVCPVTLQEELATGIPDAVHVTVEDAGHMAPMEHAEAVATHLRSWLELPSGRPVG